MSSLFQCPILVTFNYGVRGQPDRAGPKQPLPEGMRPLDGRCPWDCIHAERCTAAANFRGGNRFRHFNDDWRFDDYSYFDDWNNVFFNQDLSPAYVNSYQWNHPSGRGRRRNKRKAENFQRFGVPHKRIRVEDSATTYDAVQTEIEIKTEKMTPIKRTTPKQTKKIRAARIKVEPVDFNENFYYG